MRWPFTRRETRADSSYTDALVAAITANAGGKSTSFPTATAALEACAGFVGRAFAAAEVTAPAFATAALDPACLSLIGRALIRRGEVVLLLRVDDGRVKLWPCAAHDVDGGPDPATWTYRVTVGGPERTFTFDHVPGEGVVHLTYGRDPERPWRGYGPLQVAQLAGRLSAETVAALADETSGPRGSFLPLPVDGEDPTLSKMKADIRHAKGSILTVESGDWDTGDLTKHAAYAARRFGAAPPAPLVELLGKATGEVYSACGLSSSLFAEGDGTGRREAYRQALHSVIAPLGRMVQTELAIKLNGDVSLAWTELRAGDITGRARAFQSLVGGGMSMEAAAAASGILIPQDG